MQYHIDNGIDIGNVDLTVPIDVHGRPTGTRQDAIDQALDIGDIDLAIAVATAPVRQ